MKRNFILTMEIAVNDPAQLFDAAMKRAIEEGHSKRDAHGMLGTRRRPMDSSCLLMLLDPGSLPGCSINDTSVDSIDFLT